jgi:low affinity Fe/Cu permease
MVKKFIVIVHLILFGINVGNIVHFKSNDAMISLGIIFFTGYLALQNIMNRMLDKQEDQITNR